MAPSTDLEEQLKRALWLHIGRIVDAQTLSMGVNATPQFIAALMEATYAQIVNSGRDLESFAQHAGRERIQVQDVMMLARRNDGLKEVLNERVESLKKEKSRKQQSGD
jgi:centromere protein S